MKSLLQPLPVRIFHWTMAVTVTTLAFTGIYSYSPFLGSYAPMRVIRFIHTAAGIILIANTAGQTYYYMFIGKYSDVLIRPQDLANIRSFLRYYLFITETHPDYGKYNPGQKGIFTIMWLIVWISALIGLILLFPDQTTWLQVVMPGLNSLRFIKYLIAMSFISIIILHLYLVFTEDLARLQAMFTGYITEEPPSRKKNQQP